jgi:hypothetical protein
VHDFLQDALGPPVPYGIYEPLRNQGTVYVGNSADTPQFAVDVIARSNPASAHGVRFGCLSFFFWASSSCLASFCLSALSLSFFPPLSPIV